MVWEMYDADQFKKHFKNLKWNFYDKFSLIFPFLNFYVILYRKGLNFFKFKKPLSLQMLNIHIAPNIDLKKEKKALKMRFIYIILITYLCHHMSFNRFLILYVRQSEVWQMGFVYDSMCLGCETYYVCNILGNVKEECLNFA